MEFKDFDVMVENILYTFFNNNIFNEDFFSKKIILGKYEVYPYYNIKIIYSKSRLVVNASITPLAIVIKDKNKNKPEYYLHLFNDSKKDDKTYIMKILEKFVNFTC